MSTLNTSATILRWLREFSIYVNATRAIPRVNDGLKVSQRIALWLLKDVGDHIKTSALAGRMSGSNLYVHGEASAVGAIVRLASPFENNVPLITAESDCGFGSKLKPRDYAAPRYTLVSRSKFAQNVLYSDIEILDLVDNYDRSAQMPDTFLPLIPVILMNGVTGVGVGFATNILPRTLKAITKATIAAINGDKVGLLNPSYSKYDVDVKALGDGRYQIDGKIERSGPGRITVREIPPGMSIDEFKEKLIALEEAGEINGFVDNSAESVEVEVRLKRSVLEEKDDEGLVKFLGLRSVETENLTVISFDGNKIVKYDTPRQIVEEFVQWRFQWYAKRYSRLIAVERQTLLYWQTILACFDAGLMKKITRVKNKAILVDSIRKIAAEKSLSPSETIMDRIASMPTYRWTREGEDEAKKKAAESKSALIEYEAILASPERQKRIFADEVAAINI